jgi:hypothetical protein
MKLQTRVSLLSQSYLPIVSFHLQLVAFPAPPCVTPRKVGYVPVGYGRLQDPIRDCYYTLSHAHRISLLEATTDCL